MVHLIFIHKEKKPKINAKEDFFILWYNIYLYIEGKKKHRYIIVNISTLQR